MTKKIIIVIQGGCLRGVKDLPSGYIYEVIDLDNEPQRADEALGSL